MVPLTLGGNVFGWTIDKATSIEILDAFLDQGFDFIDTANVYSRWATGNHGGESETIIGEWFNRPAPATRSSSRPRSAWTGAAAERV